MEDVKGFSTRYEKHPASTDRGVDHIVTKREVSIFDRDEDIILEHYTRCSIESEQFIKSSRGIISQVSESGEKTLLCKTFNFTPEFLPSQYDEIKSYIGDVKLDQCKICIAKEGTILRLYYVPSKEHWNLSTHRKINAFCSKWGNSDIKSYGEIFLHCLHQEIGSRLNVKCDNGDCLCESYYDNLFDKFVETLDKKKTYAFLVLNTKSNRIVCQPSGGESIYYVGCFHGDNLEFDNPTSLSYPESKKFDSLEEITKYVKETINWKTAQGLFIYLPDNRQLKIVNEDYAKYFQLRNNEPSLAQRYIHLRKKEELDEFLKLYPEIAEQSKEIESKIKKHITKLLNSYKDRFINKFSITLPKIEHDFINKLHYLYKRQEISHEIVDKMLTVNYINYIVSQYT